MVFYPFLLQQHFAAKMQVWIKQLIMIKVKVFSSYFCLSVATNVL